MRKTLVPKIRVSRYRWFWNIPSILNRLHFYIKGLARSFRLVLKQILILTLLTIQHNQITCATYNSSTIRSYQFTPVSNVNSELRITENMHGIYAPCFFSFHFYFRFQGTKVKLSRDYKGGIRGSHFFKTIVVVFFSIS